MVSATDAGEPLDTEHGSETRSVVDGRIGQIVAATYRITRHIGSGGSSHVFAAEHLRLGKAFAVKLLRTELDSSRRAAQRFRREARAVARLHSEHVVSVIDCGELEDRTPYLVMELLEGEDLRSLLNREGSLPARRAVQIVVEACRGLTEVHEAGLVHRDLKPENLFITRRATGEDWCKVLDFGVAKMEASLSTADGAIIGTVRYMAPEQLADGPSVGPLSDVYALGAILYECLSGKPAQAGATVQEVMFSVMNKQPTELRTLCPTLPDALVALVSRCLSKRAAQRPQAASEVAALLGAVFERVPRASTSATWSDNERAIVLPRKSATSWRVGVPALVAALAGAGIAWWSKPTPRLPSAGETRPSTAERRTALDIVASAPASPAIPLPSAASSVAPSPVSSSPQAILQAPLRRPIPVRNASVSAPVKGVSVGGLDQANPYSK